MLPHYLRKCLSFVPLGYYVHVLVIASPIEVHNPPPAPMNLTQFLAELPNMARALLAGI